MKYLNKIINGIKMITAGSCLYALTLLGIQGISELISPKINNQIQLEQIIKTERKLAGIKEDIKLYVTMGRKENSQALKTGEKEYDIFLSKRGANKFTLRHELYHIADGHCDTKYNNLKYFFIQEPQATIYAATGWKF